MSRQANRQLRFIPLIFVNHAAYLEATMLSLKWHDLFAVLEARRRLQQYRYLWREGRMARWRSLGRIHLCLPCGPCCAMCFQWFGLFMAPMLAGLPPSSPLAPFNRHEESNYSRALLQRFPTGVNRDSQGAPAERV